MPIQTDLNVSPYFDDYNEKDDYYKILFRPGVAVQVRELNQLQTILQKQIERFGDNIYKRGSIIDGCNFIFHKSLPYVKIDDVETDGTPVNVSTFKGQYVKNSTNLIAQIVETAAGFEATDPDLNTLFVKYVNSGTSGKEAAFAPNQVLTVYDPSLSVMDADVTVKSSGFSNGDNAVFTSAIIVQNTTGGKDFVNATGQACTFIVGDILTQDTTGVRVEVREVNATAIPDQTVLKIRPLASNLRTGNTQSWILYKGREFTSSTSKITANVSSILGSGATGTIVTDNDGGVVTCIIIEGGSGYSVEPYITVAYSVPNNSTSVEAPINALRINAKTYKAKITVNPAVTSIGAGYGFSVSEGIIYQKGYFSRVQNNFIVVEKYSTSTNNVVGFDTAESIIDYRIDSNLYDNATGTLNVNAPGANRLQLAPKLVVLTPEEAAANNDFFPIVEFSEGRPFKQNKGTQFNSISQELARRTAEESGDYVLDQFLVSTKSKPDFEDEAANFEVVVDPGLAYINGYRIETLDNYYSSVPTGTSTIISNTSVSINYGNYVIVNEVGGLFKFSIGASVDLYDTAKTYLTTSADAAQFATISPAGTKIGVARIRSMSLVSGSAGEPNAKYYLYLFDIRMNTGKNFNNVRSIYYNGAGSSDGIADIVLNNGNAVVYDPQKSSLVFKGAATNLKNANNLVYTYRTINDSVTCATDGTMSLSVAQNPGEYFPYASTLSDIDKLSLIVVPLANAICANASGTISTTAACTTITGSTTTFNTTFVPGDYVKIANSTAAEIKRVVSIASDTSMTVSGSVANSYPAGAKIALAFPQFVPIPLYLRNNRTATITSNTTLNISLGNTISSAVTMAVTYNASTSTKAVPKTITRKAYVKINTSTNQATTNGPWCLGLCDIVRLREVYLGNSSSVTTSSPKITTNFWIDHNQKKDYYDVGFLYKKPDYVVPSNVYILVEFDVLSVTQNGLKTISSYPINDTLALGDNSSAINTLEIPEMYHDTGEYFDLRDAFDFRPYSSNTAVLTSDYTSATLNPIEPTITNRFNTTVDKKFPAPQSDCTATIENYLGRIDAVFLNSNSDIKIFQGSPSEEPKEPSIPENGLLLNYLIIPPYPSLPARRSNETNNILNRKISNIKLTTKRQSNHKITTPINEKGLKFSQPKRYTMQEIGQLEKRIADLEYYTALSATEDDVNSRELSSSANSAINRFKFGYFVDNFTTINFAEVNDPTYKAQIYGYELHPAKKQIKIAFGFNKNDKTTAECIKGSKISLKANRKTLISQPLATESTSIEVALTETITQTTGTEVTSTRKIVKEISTTEYEVITKNASKSTTSTPTTSTSTRVQTGTTIKTVADTDGTIPVLQASDSNWTSKTFEISKLGGSIYSYGGKQTGASFPILQKYNKTTKLWKDVATGYHASKEKSWTITYDAPADSENRLYRLKGGGGGKDTSILTGGTYPRSKDISVPVYSDGSTTQQAATSTPVTVTKYSIDENTKTKTDIQIIPSTTIVETTSSITKPLFSSKLTGQITIDNIFKPTNKLNSQFVDLAAFIQQDLNS